MASIVISVGVSAPASAKEDAVKQLSTPINSQADLNVYAHSYETTFLDMLSSSSKDEFLSGIDFNKYGATSFPLEGIKSELSPSQAYRFLSYFGLTASTDFLEGLRTENTIDEAIIYRSQRSSQRNDGTTTSPEDGFLVGYKCDTPGTCIQAAGFACTSNC